MQEIKGGTKRPYTRRVPKYDPAEEAKSEDPEDPKLPNWIRVKSNVALRQIVPGNVWRQGAFKWDPQPFGVESERINDRVIEPRIQDQSLLNFMDDPTDPLIYGVCGNPDDAKAKLFAAHLVALHVAHLGTRANVVWHTLYGSFDNPMLREYDAVDGKASPTMVVISNVTASSTGVKLEKCRDLIERFSEIPRIIVAAGEDPISFHSTRLYTAVNALAYFSDAMMKRRIEIL